MKRFPLAILIILLLCCYANAQSELDRSTVRDGVYTNFGFGFSFKYPKDWVVHGEATNERIREIGKEKIVESGALPKASVEVSERNSYQLLTVFHYPVGTPGITFNPGILVIAEKVDFAPGIISGKDYLLNVRAIVLKAGAQVLVKEPLECHFGGLQFYRDNYVVDSNRVSVAEAFFATVANGYALGFIFMGEDQKSVDEMAKAMETLEQMPPIRKGVTISGPPTQRSAPKP
ncbi:MAG TPA: hypothetical protein VF075_10965 [Pyrinomonadaceae bacterium]